MPGASGRVLVVDDNKVIRQLIRVNLELEGFEVVTAADGAECLDVVHQVRPDVITLDVVMPRLDGLRTAALLRADPRTRVLPLLIISGYTLREVEAGSEVAVDGYVAKPFEPAELVRAVRGLVERGVVPSGGARGDLRRSGDLGVSGVSGISGGSGASGGSGVSSVSGVLGGPGVHGVPGPGGDGDQRGGGAVPGVRGERDVRGAGEAERAAWGGGT